MYPFATIILLTAMEFYWAMEETDYHGYGVAMCTAGHLVNMAGKKGWELRDKYGYEIAAMILHEKAHPGWPCQNFGLIPDEWALAYIEEMAEREQNEEA